ncbi:MAG: hypothetical protein JWP29_2964 [Rhodoferax sp.]|nr:hypothetical protein [Rhodoferax sp.]
MQQNNHSAVHPTRTNARLRSLGTCVAAVTLVASLAACSTQPAYSDNSYPNQTSYPVQSTQQGYAVPAQPVQIAEFGRVTQIDVVRTEEKPRGSGAGAIIGGVAGAVLGNQIGGGFGRSAATAAGAIGGAVAGNAIEKNRSGPEVREVYRVSVQLDNGAYRAFDVGGGVDLRVGDRVRIENGQLIRS